MNWVGMMPVLMNSLQFNNFATAQQKHKALVTDYKHKNLGITYKMHLSNLNKYVLRWTRPFLLRQDGLSERTCIQAFRFLLVGRMVDVMENKPEEDDTDMAAEEDGNSM